MNYVRFGGKNGVLGMIYLSGVYCVVGFCEWAWNKWDQDIENFILDLLGEKIGSWDGFIVALVTLAGWGIALTLQKVVNKNNHMPHVKRE